MKQDSNSDAGKLWSDLLGEHLGLIMAISSFFFFAVRLLIISRGHKETAVFLLIHSDKVPLLLGTVLPFLPGVSVFISAILFFNWTRRRSFLGDHEENLILASILLLFGVGIISGQWTDWLIGTLTAFGLVEMPMLILFRAKFRRSSIPFKFRNTENTRVLLSRLTFTSLVLMGLFILSSTRSSLSSECVILSNGLQVRASVLSEDTKYTYIVKLPDVTPAVLESSQIAFRAVAPELIAAECKTKIKTFGRNPARAPSVTPPNK
jgi:hypothetical protein